jgi:hypothetical protein
MRHINLTLTWPFIREYLFSYDTLCILVNRPSILVKMLVELEFKALIFETFPLSPLD